MPPEMHRGLEVLARKHRKQGWTLTDALLQCVNVYLKEEQERRRIAPERVFGTRIIGYLITEVAETLARGRLQWHRDPFLFRAFKQAVVELLSADEIEPKGELRRPAVPKFLAQEYQTPESAAHFAARSVLMNLFRTEPPPDLERIFKEETQWFRNDDGAVSSHRRPRPGMPPWPELPGFKEIPAPEEELEAARNMMADLRRDFNLMSDMRRGLGIEEPKSPSKGGKQ
jgi:hypothetical protein